MAKLQVRKLRALALLAIGVMMLLVLVPRNTYAATSLQGNDFTAQSFSKVVDYYDYVRTYALNNGYNITSIQNQHAYIYTTYINVGGFQLFYSGLLNATHNNMNVTIPIQTVFEHFHTPAGKDAITASSFLSLVTFRENGTGIDKFPNSPDRNDTVFASFSLGYTLSAFGTHPVPTYVANAQVIPLTSTDSNHWTWGLNYTNLNSIWWRIYPDPLTPLWDVGTPRAFAQYSQLSFTYTLAIDPNAKTATLTTSYTVGKVTDLYLLTTTPRVLHLNSTGTYDLNGVSQGPQTVYQYLAQNGYKLSIVQSHMAILANTSTSDATSGGSSVDNNNETDVTHTNVNTVASDNEKVFTTNFGVKSSYQLYNSTSGTQSNYNVTTRTANRPAWGGNPVYGVQNAFMSFLPLFVYHVDPSLFQAAKAGMVSFKVASYLYIISYPTWSGYKIVNDPQYEAFYQPSSGTGLLIIIFIAIAVAAGIGGVFAFLFRRRRSTTPIVSPTNTPTQSPGPWTGPSGRPE
jgi:hypothetical protein